MLILNPQTHHMQSNGHSNCNYYNNHAVWKQTGSDWFSPWGLIQCTEALLNICHHLKVRLTIKDTQAWNTTKPMCLICWIKLQSWFTCTRNTHNTHNHHQHSLIYKMFTFLVSTSAYSSEHNRIQKRQPQMGHSAIKAKWVRHNLH